MHQVNQTAREVQKLRIEWSHNLRSLLDKPGRSTDENMTTQWMIWTCMWLFGGKLQNATLRAAVHLGQDCEAN